MLHGGVSKRDLYIMKRTKIVCTIGPASESKSKIEKMIKSGLNVARLNFSHGTYKHHAMTHFSDEVEQIDISDIRH